MRATEARPGSEEKIAVLSQRVAEGHNRYLSLHHPDDEKRLTEPHCPACWPSPEEVSEHDRPQPLLTQIPEQEVAVAVIQQSVEDVKTYLKLRGRPATTLSEMDAARFHAEHAVHWLFEEDDPSHCLGLTFSDCCDAFGADVDHTREALATRLGIQEGTLCEL